MNSILLPFLFTLFLQQPQAPVLATAVAPVPPPNSAFSGLVVLNVQPAANGAVQSVSALAGAEPFLESSIPAVSQWKFEPAPENGRLAPASVTMLYRTRDMFSFGGSTEFAARPVSGDRPPLPRSISNPGYPPNSIGEGVVILQLKVASDGAVEQIETLRDAPGLTGAARTAVAAWRFWPARIGGMPAPGTAIVAISFLRPIVY